MAKTLSISLPDEVYEHLDKIREKTGASISWQIQRSLEATLDDIGIDSENIAQELK